MPHTTTMEDILQEAIDTWGEQAQLTMVSEECAELIKEVCKVQRKGNYSDALYDEIADVHIMLAQLERISTKHDAQAQVKIAEKKEFKLRRLKERLESWHAHHGRTNNH